MKAVLIFAIVMAGVSVQAVEIQCPERYPSGNRLIDDGVLRYDNGNRLKDGEVWRYNSGNRLVDGDVWRYDSGNRLVDGAVWRYDSGNRLRDGEIFRYESGNRMRDNGVFKTEVGNVVGGDSFNYSFSSADGTSIDVELTKKTEKMTVGIENNGHFYELTYDPTAGSQPTKIKCILDQTDTGSPSFKLDTKAAKIEVKVKNGFSPAEVRKALIDALNEL